MINITFKNLDPSQLAKEAVLEKWDRIVERFPDLSSSKSVISIEMDNSPTQPGPDLFRIKLRVRGSKYDGVILEKQAASLYIALADLSDHLLERLNRIGDKARVKARTQARKRLEKSTHQQS